MSDLFPSPAPARDPGPADLDGEVVGGATDAVDPARRRRLVLLVAAAGVLLVGGGAAAAVSMFGMPGSGGEPSTVVGAPRPSPTPSVTEAATDPASDADVGATGPDSPGDGGDPALGRNVFAPLVDVGSADAGTDPLAGDPGTGSMPGDPLPTAAPAPTLVETVTVPGPTVTSTQVIAGPTVTATTTVTTTPAYRYVVEVVSVADPASATSSATFRVNGDAQTVAAGATFGPGGELTYEGYSVGTGQVTVTTGSTSVSLPPGTSVAIP